MLENGFLGLILVLAALTLFLQIRLAFWVALGIAISFVGALVFMLLLQVSINTVSIFAFILAVGIVIDDAIVVAEHIHAERQKGAAPLIAAIRGTQRIKRPVIFAVLTTVAAFSPLLFLPGPIGVAMGSISVIVISILLLSLVESLLILPNHLSHLPGPDSTPSNAAGRFLAKVHARVDDGLARFVEGPWTAGFDWRPTSPLL